jgi:hypothetical protein
VSDYTLMVACWQSVYFFYDKWDLQIIVDSKFGDIPRCSSYFVAVVKILQSRCLAKMGIFLPNCCLETVGGYAYRHKDWYEDFIQYAVEMGLCAIIYTYIPSFMRIRSAIQKLQGGYTDTQTAWWSHKPIFIFQNKESGIKNRIEIPNAMNLCLQLPNNITYMLCISDYRRGSDW